MKNCVRIRKWWMFTNIYFTYFLLHMRKVAQRMMSRTSKTAATMMSASSRSRSIILLLADCTSTAGWGKHYQHMVSIDHTEMLYTNGGCYQPNFSYESIRKIPLFYQQHRIRKWRSTLVFYYINRAFRIIILLKSKTFLSNHVWNIKSWNTHDNFYNIVLLKKMDQRLIILVY